MLVGLINKHKRSEISNDEYFNKLVTIITRGDEDVLDNSELAEW